jgi:hypothetical protein
MATKPTAYTHDALVRLLTRLDGLETAQERTRRLMPNIHRLAHYLGAAQDMRDDVARGVAPHTAFADTFTPTRGMHRIARTLGFPLEVERGQWVPREGTR